MTQSTPAIPGAAYPDATWPGRVDDTPVTPPTHPDGRGYRLVAHHPSGPGQSGARIGPLPEPLEWDATIGHSETTALTITYSRDSVRGTDLDRRLTDGTEVAVEAWNGTAWVEPDGARYLVSSRRYDSKDMDDGTRQRVTRYVGMSIPVILTKAHSANVAALLPDDDETNPGKRPFLSATVGTIMATLLQEYEGRGGYAYSRGFTTQNDSAGQAWSKVTTVHYDHLQRLDVILDNLVGQGMCEYTTRGRELRIMRVTNTGAGGLAPDLSATIRYHLGVHVTEAPSEESITEMVSRVHFAGGDGLRITETDNSVPRPWGHFEGAYTNNSVTVEGTARAYTQAEIARAGRVRGQYIRNLSPVLPAGSPIPLVAFEPGAWITAPGATSQERLRVQQVVIRVDQDGTPDVGLVLNDRFIDADIRRARRQAGIVGGSTVTGENNVRPKPPGQEKRQPAQPTGVVASTEAYLDRLDNPRALVALSWAQVSTATDSTALEVDGYEVEGREGTSGDWRYRKRTDTNSITFDRLPTSTVTQWRVRAIGRYATRLGAWSATRQITTAAYVEPPPIPSAPQVTSSLGIINVRWNGQTESGTQMPGSFRSVEIAITASPTPNPPGPPASSIVESLTYLGGIPLYGHPLGAVRYVRLRAVGAGGRSEWSPEVSVTVKGIDAPDLEAASIWANSAFLGLARTQILQVGAIPPNRLSFGTDEISPNPVWLDADLRAKYPASPAGWSYSTQAGPRRLGQTHTVAISGSGSPTDAIMPLTGDVPVSPGERIALELWGYRTPSADFNVRLGFRFTLVGGGTSQSSIALTPSEPASTARSVTGVLTVPDGAVSAVLALWVNAGPTSGVWYVSSTSARKALTSSDPTGEGMEITPRGIRAWDESGNPTIDLGHGTPNLISGRIFRTDRAGGGRPQVVLSNSVVDTGIPAVWLLDDGNATGASARIFLRTTAATGSKGLLSLISGQYGTLGERHPVRAEYGLEAIMGPIQGGTGNQTNPIITWRIDEQGNADFSIGNTNQRMFDVPQNGIMFRSGNNQNSTFGSMYDSSGYWFRADPVFRRTTTSAANVFVNQFGQMSRSTSLREHKLDIAPLPDQTEAFMQLQPETWRDRGSVERGEHAPLQTGFVAEAVQETGLAGVLSFDNDGDLIGLQYDRFTAVLVQQLQNALRRIDTLEAQNAP